MKKAQSHGLVVVYLLTAVVVFLILTFGYTTILEFKYRSVSGRLSELKVGIESEITVISSQYGSIKYKVFSTPMLLEKVCFVETTANPIDFTGKHPLIEDSVKSGAKENAFFIGKEIFESTYVGSIIIDHETNINCGEVGQNQTGINFEGRGHSAVISFSN